MTTETEKSLGWYYAAWDDSEIWNGPHENRALAIQAAINDNPEWDQVSVCECFTDALRLADWIALDTILEDAEERLMDGERINTDFEDGPFFVCSAEAEEDLKSRSRFAIRTSGRTGRWGSFTVPLMAEDRAMIGDAVVCPEQRDAMAGFPKLTHCGSCGLCWKSDPAGLGRPIAFIEH